MKYKRLHKGMVVDSSNDFEDLVGDDDALAGPYDFYNYDGRVVGDYWVVADRGLLKEHIAELPPATTDEDLWELACPMGANAYKLDIIVFVNP